MLYIIILHQALLANCDKKHHSFEKDTFRLMYKKSKSSAFISLYPNPWRIKIKKKVEFFLFERPFIIYDRAVQSPLKHDRYSKQSARITYTFLKLFPWICQLDKM